MAQIYGFFGKKNKITDFSLLSITIMVFKTIISFLLPHFRIGGKGRNFTSYFGITAWRRGGIPTLPFTCACLHFAQHTCAQYKQICTSRRRCATCALPAYQKLLIIVLIKTKRLSKVIYLYLRNILKYNTTFDNLP